MAGGLCIGVALVLVSCATGPATTTSPSQTTTTSPVTTTSPPITTAGAQAPQYGGTFVKAYGSDPNGFDEVIGFAAQPTSTIHLTNESLLTGDWAKGPAGTDDTDWAIGGLNRQAFKTGQIAESWEFPELGTTVYHIRHGIHWWLNPKSDASKLVNGRELTADDVVFTLNMYITQPRAYLHNQPGLSSANITALDKYTVQIKVEPEYQAASFMRFGDFADIVPPEVVQKYGDMSDWHQAEGTGPYMLTDYVAGSSITMARNSNYWDKDPVGPGKGNQLPYLDGVTYLIIPDSSTQQAAFRTGKIDLFQTDWETAPLLLKANPGLLSGTNIFDGGFNTAMNTKNAPFNDVRVRQALMMAIDWPDLVNGLFGGNAEINVWPVTYNKQYANLYLSLDDPECPADVKQLYEYHPDLAKQLLTEAGYPNGFKTTVICSSSTIGAPNNVDYYSAIKEMWAKVGVDLTIDPKDPGVLSTINQGLKFDQMCWASMGGLGTAFVGTNYYGPGFANASQVSDPYVTQQVQLMIKTVAEQGEDAADPIHKEFMKYVLAQAYQIPFPKAPGWRLWWPWLKNYANEFSVGYWDEGNYAKWLWIDQNQKKSMGY